MPLTEQVLVLVAKDVPHTPQRLIPVLPASVELLDVVQELGELLVRELGPESGKGRETQGVGMNSRKEGIRECFIYRYLVGGEGRGPSQGATTRTAHLAT